MTLFLVGVSLLGVTAPAGAQVPARLTRVQVLDAPHATAIHLYIEGAPGSVTSEVRDDPSRLLLSLGGTANATGEVKIEVGGPRAARVELKAEPDGTLQLSVIPGRAVDPFRNYGVSPTDRGILLTVGVGELVLQPQEEAPPAPPQTPPAPVAPAPRKAAEAPVTPPAPPTPAPPPAPERAAAEPPPPSPPPAAEPPQPERVRPPGEFREATDQEISAREPTRADGLVYPVGEVRVEYARIAVGQPDIRELTDIDVALLRTPQGYVAPRQGVQFDTVPIARPVSLPAAPFYGSAIRAMNQAIVDEFNRRGLVGVLVRPHPEDIDPSSSRDLREDGNTTLRLVVWTGRLLESRTFASGERIPEDARIDNPALERVKDGSPVHPGEILNKNELDAYVARLNRHPGRTVDLTLTKSLEPGGVYLDYLVAENKPWSAYVQGSNTGTPETSRWRERFGFVHNQATGRDDILRLDYVTGDFDTVHAAFGSYELPLPLGPLEQRVRLRMGGSWSQFDASEVGINDSRFEGNQWTGSTQALVNVFQYRDLFVDVFAGARYQRVENKSQPIPGFAIDRGRANFFFSELGLRLERQTEESTLQLGVSGEANIPGIAGTQRSDFQTASEKQPMGRPGITERYVKILRWDALASFYLEPLFSSYEDPSTPQSSTLAHEIFLQSWGQLTDNRLIPYQQAIAGGLNSVRGYEQSLLAGDEGIFFRGEYRLHVPRLFPIQPTPASLPLVGDFRVAPQQVYGRPDWDLVLRGFVDGARLENNDLQPGDFRREDMLSVGAGVELQLLSNFIGRFDYGYALRKAGTDDPGDDAFHLSFTIVY